jgi:hypothetical protein
MEFPIVEFFVMGGILTWLAILGAFTVISFAMYRDSYAAAVGFFIATVVALTLFGPLVPTIQGIEFTFWLVLKWFGTHICCGVAWGMFKYLVLFTSEIKDKYYSAKREWLRKEGVEGDTVPVDKKEAFQVYLANSSEFGKYLGNKRVVSVKPDAWDHKADITAWMVFWPFSLAETVLGDLLRIVYRRIQTLLGRMMNAMTDFMFKGIEKDWK